MLKTESTTQGTNSMPFLIFRRDHLRSTSGIICGSGSFAVQFGGHFWSGDHLRSVIICGAVQVLINTDTQIKFSFIHSIPFHSIHEEMRRFLGLRVVSINTTKAFIRMHRQTGTFGPGGSVIFLPIKLITNG